MATRERYVELPREDPDFGDKECMVGRLRLALYGTRDAALLLQECLAEHLAECGFVRGVSDPCVYYHESRDLRTLVHGDDYASTGAASDLRWLRDRLEKKFEMKTTIVGHSSEADVVKEGEVLNRLVHATSHGWECECDQRHVELLV